jgi:ABC-type phosphate transport system substrate-binding protein
MLKKSKLRVGAVACLAIAGLAFGAFSASADPAAGTYKALNGVGSDTIQDVVNGLATAIPSIGSYDATGTATIKTTAAGNTFARPNGSGAGQQALSASANNTGTRTYPATGGVDITGQVDFARSSSAPSSSFPGTDLTFIPFARDAVSYAVNSASDFPRDLLVGSAAQDALSPAPFTLRNIYRCAVTTFSNADGDPVTIRPLLPQSGSGTRSFWLSTLGLTEAQVTGCASDLGGTIQEHDGSKIKGAGDIVPFSVAQYLSQSNYKTLPTTVDERRGVIDLGRIGGTKPILLTANGNELNTAFPVNRLVFNVVQTSRLGEAGIAAAFVGSTSSVCSNAAIIRQYGFGTIGTLCGNTTTYKQGFRY